MVHIKDGEGAFTRKTVAVLRKQRIRSQGADTAAAVDGFGPGVPDQVSESAREAPAELHAERVVISIHTPVYFLNASNLGVRRSGGHRAGSTRQRFIKSSQALQPVTHGPKIANLEDRLRVQFALDVQQVLDGIRGSTVIDIGQNVGPRYDHTGARIVKRMTEGQRIRSIGIIAPPAAKIAFRVKARVARVLRIKDAAARPNSPTAARTPRDAKTRCEVSAVSSDQPISEAAIARHLDSRVEANELSLIKVSCSHPDQDGMTAQVRHVGSRVQKRDVSVHLALPFISPGRNELVTQTQVDRQVWPYLPDVIHIIRLRGGAKLGHRQGEGRLVLARISEQVVSKVVVGGLPVNNKGATRKLIACLIEAVAPNFEPKTQRVLSPNPGEIIHPLKSDIAVFVRALRVVTKAVEIIETDSRNPPRRRGGMREIRDIQLRQHVALEGQFATGTVKEFVRAKAKLVHLGR